MADEAERVGGISVEASITQGAVDAQLNSLLAKMQAAAREMSAALTIHPTVATPAVQPRAVSAPQQTAAQAAQITFGRKAAAGAKEYTSLEKAIQDALAKESGALEQVGDKVQRTARARQAEFVQDVHASPAAEPLVLAVSTTEAKEQLSTFLAEFKAEMAAAQEAATIKIQVQRPTRGATAAAGSGGGAGPAAASSALTSHDRRVNEDLAAKVGRSVRGTAGTGDARRLTELSYLNQQDQNLARESGTVAGRQRTPQEIAAFRQANAAAANQPPPDPARAAAERRARSEDLARQNATFARVPRATDETTGRVRGAGAGVAARRLSEQDIAEQEAQRLATATGSRFTAGRTLRTFESSFGGFLGGGRGFLEAQTALAAANQRVKVSERDVAEARAFANRPEVRAHAEAYKDAVDDVAAAEQRNTEALAGRAKALERVQSFTGPAAAIRTFAGIGVATIGFSLALKGVGVALDAIGPALADFIDLQTGFASKSTAVTSALAQQTEAQKGNVNAVLAQQAATAGLSGSTADYIDAQLKLTTQVKAGALAEKQSSDLFKAAQGTNQNAPQGLNGGFGGLLGTPFLAGTIGGGPGFRETVAGNVRQSAGPLVSTTGRFGDVPGTLNDILGSLNPFGENFANPGLQIQRRDAAATLAAGETPALTHQINDLNDSAKRAAVATGQQVAATFAYTKNTDDIAKAVAIAKAAGDDLGASMASMGLVVRDASGNIADFTTSMRAWSQAAVGQGIPATEALGALAKAQETQREREAAAAIPAQQQQFAYERPAFLAGTQRQQQFQQFTQLPAQQALANLAQPLLPTSTGIVAANRKEQERINTDLKGANALQTELNTNYAAGLKVLEETYKPQVIKDFGSAAGAAFQTALNGVVSTGRQIASLQTGIVNEQAAYQVAQYNYQLFIAKRSLADIGGLTGKNFGAGESYLGVLERQNLALSRQGQLLQFTLQQRQINFQTALAGFQAPGVTPEERQANIKEAQIEASYAQKQLDIQRQMFGNQVKIVDIQNLRQGADLARQIGLLLQGRQVTIDVKVKTAELERAQQLQQQQVAAVGTYLSAVDSVVNHDFAQMAALETAAGRAMFGAAKYAADAFNKYLTMVVGSLGSFSAALGQPNDLGSNRRGYAGGALFNTGGGPVGMMTIGENDHNETVAILRSPRTAMLGSGSGGGDVIFNGDINVRSESDIDLIARKVQQSMGRTAALKGLRAGG